MTSSRIAEFFDSRVVVALLAALMAPRLLSTGPRFVSTSTESASSRLGIRRTAPVALGSTVSRRTSNSTSSAWREERWSSKGPGRLCLRTAGSTARPEARDRSRAANGDLLVAYSGDRGAHISDDGKVRLLRSRDHGRTWIKPVTIVDTPLDDRDGGNTWDTDAEIHLATRFRSESRSGLVAQSSARRKQGTFSSFQGSKWGCLVSENPEEILA